MKNVRQIFIMFLTVAIFTATVFSGNGAVAFADDESNGDNAILTEVAGDSDVDVVPNPTSVKASAAGEEDSTAATVRLISIDGVTVPTYDIDVYVSSNKVTKDELGNIADEDYQNELKESKAEGYTFDISLEKDRLYFLDSGYYINEGLPYADVVGYINVNGNYEFIRIASEEDYNAVRENMANGTEFSQELISKITGKSKTVDLYVGKTKERYMDTPAAEIIVVDKDGYKVTKGAKFKIVNTETGEGEDYTIDNGFIKTKELKCGVIYEIIPDSATWVLTTLMKYENTSQYRFFAIEEVDGKYSVIVSGGGLFGPIVGPIGPIVEGEEAPQEAVLSDEEREAMEAKSAKEAIHFHLKSREIDKEISKKYDQIDELWDKYDNTTDQSEKEELGKQIEELYDQITALRVELRQMSPIRPDIGSEVEIPEIELLDPVFMRRDIVLYALAPLVTDPVNPDPINPDPGKPTSDKPNPDKPDSSDPIPSVSVVPAQSTDSSAPDAIIPTGDSSNFKTYIAVGAIAVIALMALLLYRKKHTDSHY